MIEKFCKKYVRSPFLYFVLLPSFFLFPLAIYLISSGAVQASWLFATFVGWVLCSGFGINVGFHRLLSHKAFLTTPWRRRFLTFCGCMGAQGSPVVWAAVHRHLHHPHSDQDKDLHSPIHGLWHSYMGWYWKVGPEHVNLRAVADLLRDPFIKFCHNHYTDVVFGVIVATALIDWRLALFLWCVPIVIANTEESFVNCFLHLRGTPATYRNFDTPDDSQNLAWISPFTWGQGFHNNHHAKPNTWDYGYQSSGKWWELDPCRLLIPFVKTGDQPDHYLHKTYVREQV